MITDRRFGAQFPILIVEPTPPAPATAPIAEPAAEAAPTFERVYDEHFAFVWRTLRRQGVDASRLDDVVQDVFLAVAQRLSSYDPSRGHVRSWLYGITMNIVQNERRRYRRKDAPNLPLETDDDSGRNLADRLPSVTPGPGQSVETAEAMRIAWELLESVPEERREVLVLADLEEMPVVEIAESLGLNVNTTHSRLRAARREFDEALARFRAREARRHP